ncbi:MAG: bifunctional DNA-formamidopyrimidine glycosylase/DNA-(apurinic or apyrimidinic site) lyase [Alphaproteobacteria bacterium]|nr:bifunctional DNA-formamidopyrimidine glycosylase/DNA-(apurinic or apyrimidinic site) lyase [Alphaproteobacteria bacterium]
MPELPEVETAMRGLEARLVGREIVDFAQHRADLRFPLPDALPERLPGCRILGFRRRAKYILARLDNGHSLLLHLGMSGRLLFDGEPAGPHEHLTFRFDDGTTLRYVDPRRFGMLDLVSEGLLESHPRLAGLGLEPLDPDFDGKALKRVLKGRASPIKTAIMNQRLVVGVGNIYACESLFKAKISPHRQADSLTSQACRRLADAIRKVLQAAIEAGGSSLRDYVQTDGELGYFQHHFDVYGRADEPCPACHRPIKTSTQANRTTFYCQHCQR